MSIKSTFALATLSLALTPITIAAITGAAARQPSPVPVPIPLAELKAMEGKTAPEKAADIALVPVLAAPAAKPCLKTVRVVAGGYGEPVVARCDVRRSELTR